MERMPVQNEEEKTLTAFHVKAKGLDVEVHFRFTNEPHILLAQIAQKTAKNVYIKKSGKIDRCTVISQNVDPDTPALQTAGVDFHAFWNMQDDLNIENLVSNDIHAVLKTYGVEAARATIINEVKGVFGSYGISVNIRHLILIADFMTHSGRYRPMSRHGIVESVSPLSKMTFETASKFIVDAAYHGEMDDLEAPSARICLGLPVKMGTGCFDLMQKLEV
ncbi:DNA-directed RNA polymerase I subunit 1-like [Telopea speciosissima]|uniref:DNA-directed RNA polymerase I subunit 1-like n=1 Tax=Telopea speciosissima TaxID=54955 RepID=UPI001CC72289|nr:DNA-directed RNA polymerase I subunit 1-like [Telopea speciosissima]